LAQRDRFVEILNRYGEVHEMEQHRRKRSGETVVCRVSGFRVEIGGRPCTLYRIRDITRERLAEQALRESEEKYSKAFRGTPDAISITTISDGRFLEVNDGFTRMVGWTREEPIGRSALDLRVWADPAERGRMAPKLQAGESVTNLPVGMRDKLGGLHQGLFSADVVDIGGQPRLLAMVHDVTEQQRLEEQLRHAQKMESIGQLAGGVATSTTFSPSSRDTPRSSCRIRLSRPRRWPRCSRSRRARGLRPTSPGSCCCSAAGRCSSPAASPSPG
jgi:PAS domain S-box-containing protein